MSEPALALVLRGKGPPLTSNSTSRTAASSPSGTVGRLRTRLVRLTHTIMNDDSKQQLCATGRGTLQDRSTYTKPQRNKQQQTKKKTKTKKESAPETPPRHTVMKERTTYALSPHTTTLEYKLQQQSSTRAHTRTYTHSQMRA